MLSYCVALCYLIFTQRRGGSDQPPKRFRSEARSDSRRRSTDSHGRMYERDERESHQANVRRSSRQISSYSSRSSWGSSEQSHRTAAAAEQSGEYPWHRRPREHEKEDWGREKEDWDEELKQSTKAEREKDELDKSSEEPRSSGTFEPAEQTQVMAETSFKSSNQIPGKATTPIVKQLAAKPKVVAKSTVTAKANSQEEKATPKAKSQEEKATPLPLDDSSKEMEKQTGNTAPSEDPAIKKKDQPLADEKVQSPSPSYTPTVPDEEATAAKMGATQPPHPEDAAQPLVLEEVKQQEEVKLQEKDIEEEKQQEEVKLQEKDIEEVKQQEEVKLQEKDIEEVKEDKLSEDAIQLEQSLKELETLQQCQPADSPQMSPITPSQQATAGVLQEEAPDLELQQQVTKLAMWATRSRFAASLANFCSEQASQALRAAVLGNPLLRERICALSPEEMLAFVRDDSINVMPAVGAGNLFEKQLLGDMVALLRSLLRASEVPAAAAEAAGVPVAAAGLPIAASVPAVSVPAVAVPAVEVQAVEVPLAKEEAELELARPRPQQLTFSLD